MGWLREGSRSNSPKKAILRFKEHSLIDKCEVHGINSLWEFTRQKRLVCNNQPHLPSTPW
jgi:hypothetical protein